MTEGNGWSAYERLILFRLDQQDLRAATIAKKVEDTAKELARTVEESSTKLDEKLQALQESVTVLKTKATVFGTLGGIGAGTFIQWLFSR